MRHGVLFSLQAPGGGDHRALYDAAIEQTVRAEELGYDWVNLTEHHVSADGYCPALLPVLAAMATATARIRLSTGMLLLALHHPIRIAEEAAVVDLLSGGRLTLGVAVGYRRVEFDALGVEYRKRGRRFSEALEILRMAWTGEPFAYQGEVFTIPEVTVRPRPVQRPHPPLWIGGHSDRALERVARHDAPLFPGATDPVATVVERMARLVELREGMGRAGDPGLVLPRLAVVADTTAEARRRALPAIEAMFATYREFGVPTDLMGALRDWRDLEAFVIVGDEERCADAVARYAELGVTDLMLQFALPGLDPAVAAESLERFPTVQRTRSVSP